MSYATIAVIAANQAMRQRIAACAAQEGVTAPENWAFTNSFRWAASPGWATAWESALASNPTADPGANEACITDGMILSAVQPMINSPVV